MNGYLCSRKYKRGAFLVVFALIIQLMTGTTVKAEDNSQLIGGMQVNFTNVSIKNDKDEEVGTDGNPIKQGSTVIVRYDMALENCTELTTDQALHITLPEQLKLINDEEIALMAIVRDEDGNLVKDENGNTIEIQVGTCQLKKENGTGEITFNNILKEYDGAAIGFEVGVRVDVSTKPGEEEEIKIPFKVGGQIIEATFAFEGEDKPEEIIVPPSIDKQCEVIDEANNQITWVVTVKAGSNPLEGAHLIENFKKDELTFNSAYIKLENDTTKAVEFSSKDSEDETVTVLVHDIPNLEAETEYIVYIVTDINEDIYKVDEATESTGITKTITNKASLQYTLNGETVTEDDSAEAKIKLNMITKEGAAKTSSDGVRTIEWKVTINGNRRNLAGYTLVDRIPKGLELKEDSVKLVWKDAEENNQERNLVKGDVLTVDQYTYKANQSTQIINGVKVNFIGEMTYEFLEEAGNYQYTLTYTTEVIDDSILDTNNIAKFYNYVQLSGPGIGEEVNVYYDFTGVGFSTSMVKKEGTYHRDTHTITWQVTINNNKLALQEAEILDAIPNGLSLVEDSVRIAQEAKKLNSTNSEFITIRNENTLLEENIVAFYNYDTSNRLLKCKLVGDFSVPYTIRFDTTVDNPEIYASNNLVGNEYKNMVTFNGKKQNTTDTLPQSEASAKVKVTSEVIKKQAAYYDYKTREIIWLITINQNEMEIKDAIVTDRLPDNQQYVEGSFKLMQGTCIYKDDEYKLNGKVYEEEGLPNEADSKYLDVQPLADNSQQLTYTFSNKINDTYTILFKSQIKEDSLNEIFASAGSVKITNEVGITGSPIPDGVNEKADITIRNQSIYKKGTQEKKDEPIKWEITVNQNKLVIDNAVITDELSSGLELDTDTLHLYRMDVDDKGNVIESSKEEVNINPQNITYDRETNKISFKFNNTISSCYRLVFATNITDTKPQKNYTNKAYFEGNQIEKEQNGSEQVKVEVQFSKSWGSVYKKRGKIEVTKVDSETGNALEGAIFNLLDKNGIILAISAGESIVTFNDLIVGREYQIEEVTAPQGYKKQESNYKFTLQNAETLKVNIPNEKLKSGVQFKKVDIHNKAVSGATFGLYLKVEDKEPKYTATSNFSGLVTFENIEVGQYFLKEIKAPEGYICSNQFYKVEINTDVDKLSKIVKPGDDNAVNITEIVNEKMKGNITVTKVNESNEALKGAKITLLDSNKQEIKTVETDEAGMAYFNDIEYGTYYIQETKAPQGYTLDNKLNTVMVNGPETALKLVNIITPPSPPKHDDDDNDDYGSIQVIKVNENSQLLKGAEITLLNSNKDAIRVIMTDKDGEAYFGNLSYGTYYIKESKAPEGYILDETLNKIIVNGTEALKIVNKKQSTGDKDDDEPTVNPGTDKPNQSTPQPDNPAPGSPAPGDPIPSETPEAPVSKPSLVPEPEQGEMTAGLPSPQPTGEPLPKTGDKSQSYAISLAEVLFICLGGGIIIYHNKKKLLGRK